MQQIRKRPAAAPEHTNHVVQKALPTFNKVLVKISPLKTIKHGPFFSGPVFGITGFKAAETHFQACITHVLASGQYLEDTRKQVLPCLLRHPAPITSSKVPIANIAEWELSYIWFEEISFNVRLHTAPLANAGVLRLWAGERAISLLNDVEERMFRMDESGGFFQCRLLLIDRGRMIATLTRCRPLKCLVGRCECTLAQFQL